MFWRCELWQDHVKEGCFPDCDMLPLGKVGKGFETGERDCLFTREEQKTMMTLWCMFRSPLMIGAELTKMDDFTLSLLTNKELLVLLSEDFRGEQLRRSDGEADWKNTSTKTGMITAALFNLSDTDREICLNIEELSGREPDKDSYEFTELWSGEVLHSGKEALTVVVPAHGTKVFSVRQIIKILFRPVLLRSNTGYFFELFMKVGAAGKSSFFCNNELTAGDKVLFVATEPYGIPQLVLSRSSFALSMRMDVM